MAGKLLAASGSLRPAEGRSKVIERRLGNGCLQFLAGVDSSLFYAESLLFVPGGRQFPMVHSTVVAAASGCRLIRHRDNLYANLDLARACHRRMPLLRPALACCVALQAGAPIRPQSLSPSATVPEIAARCGRARPQEAGPATRTPIPWLIKSETKVLPFVSGLISNARMRFAEPNHVPISMAVAKPMCCSTAK
jgi:hypothetical protein